MEHREETDSKIELDGGHSAKAFIKDLLTTLKVEVEREDVKILAGKYRTPTHASENISNPKFSKNFQIRVGILLPVVRKAGTKKGVDEFDRSRYPDSFSV